jgi:hypothetical protein
LVRRQYVLTDKYEKEVGTSFVTIPNMDLGSSVRKWGDKALSRALYGKQVAIVLGSGASIDHIPGTAAITAALKQWTKYYVPNQPKLDVMAALDATAYDGSGTQPTYFEALYNALAPHFQDPATFLHFERLIHVAQSLDRHTSGFLNDKNDYLMSGPGPLAPIGNLVPGFDNRIHSVIASAATKFILDHIAGIERGKTDLDADPLNKFVADLSKHAYIRLFSLNYDTVPVHSGVAFETGFFRETGDIAESFYPARLRHAFRSHVFCQLHGSALWAYAPDEHKGPGLVVRFPDLDTAMDKEQVPPRSAAGRPSCASYHCF